MSDKIGILTFHASNNSGSMLQAYALQRFLKEKYSLDTEIIDYSNKIQQRMYKIIIWPKSLKGFVRNFIFLCFYGKIARSEKGYDEFKDNFVLGDRITTISEFESSVLDYSGIIIGSDQVWNVHALDFDESYMLPFYHGKKIAYAVSLGATNPNNEPDKNKYQRYINDFSAVSVRENNAKIWIEELTEHKIDICVDPTLLLKKEEWAELADERLIDEPYIFWYAMTYKKDQAKLLKSISEKYNMPVYVMNAKEWTRRALYTKGIRLATKGGPKVFLSLVANAKLVITSSFHGSVFSYLFNKNFWYINLHKERENDDRASFLLKQLNLSDRYISPEDALTKDLSEYPNFNSENLKSYIDKSIEFIESQIVD